MDDHANSIPLTGTRRSHSYLLRLWQEAFLKGWMGETESINGGKDTNEGNAPI